VDKKLVVEDSLPAGTAVMTDGTLLQRILGNLIDNACKYARQAVDNRIHLRTGPGVGGAVVLEVADHGPGVPRAERRSIFRAFRQGQDADPTAGGVGLGLALAKRWAGLLGGRLSYRDEPGGGACFGLELPASAVCNDKAEKPA
jgi:signal transduction histidine kinase